MRISACASGWKRIVSAIRLRTSGTNRLTVAEPAKAPARTNGHPRRAKLDELAVKSKQLKLEVILAVGHTDRIGSDAYNQKLSQRRAESVRQYLIGKGLPASRLDAIGKGESNPIADNATAEGRAQNRRVLLVRTSR